MALVVSLTVLLGVLALAVDWAYVNMAHVELSRATEAASLAAAHALVHEDQLRGPYEIARVQRRAVKAAREFARVNWTAGEPTDLEFHGNESPESDIQFGHLIRTVGGPSEFVADSSGLPDTVQVIARRTGSRNNPLGLLLGPFLGVSSAELVAQSLATLDDRIVGFAPVGEVPVPMVPLAILLNDPQGRRNDTWETAIAQRLGGDSFGFDPAKNQVVAGADGIPEIELVGSPSQVEASRQAANVSLLDLGDGIAVHATERRIQFGLEPSDLRRLGGTLRLDTANHLVLPGTARISTDLADTFQEIRGQCRVWCVYASDAGSSHTATSRFTVVGFVGARVLQVRFTDDGRFALRVQPCFVITRSAIAEPANRAVPKNFYVRKLSITG